MTANNTQPAHNPALFNSRSVLRPLSNKENMQRANAIAANKKPLSAKNVLACKGQIFVGMFFDGTGNNEEADYKKIANPADRQHSNVVRLYHAYPDRVTKNTDKYYGYYIPGVGTPFPEIGDDGAPLMGILPLGTAGAWNGEPRLIWGLTNVFNAVSDFVSDDDLIPKAQAAQIANSAGGLLGLAAQRKYAFKSTWSGRLKAKVAGRRKGKPEPEQINISVYGFSRGAAEARAFVNWLYEICDEEGGAFVFCGIPLRIEFLGLFDTVASVGLAGGWTSGGLATEGHQSWADKNMQVHPGVESCLHLVAAHEVRSTFPVDSVRIDGIYPPNCKEYVYPGSHSDVGGGYHPRAYGKTDALARIPGYEMYCAALAAGVPFYSIEQMKKVQADAASNLLPLQKTVDIFKAYMQQAAIKPGPVEDMMRQHMAHYFTYRYQARNDAANNNVGISYVKRKFYAKASEKEFLRDTQQHFIAILAAVSSTLDYIMENETTYDEFIVQPFGGKGSYIPEIAVYRYLGTLLTRPLVLSDSLDTGYRDKKADKVHEKIKVWRKWLSDHHSPDLVDADAPERDVLSVIDTLSDVSLDAKVVEFFDDWVHDSMAGLAKDKVNEFLEVNGIGIVKFRRVFFGNNGDAMTKEKAKQINEQRAKVSDAQRMGIQAEKDQRAKWDAESAEYQMMTRGR